MNIGLHRYKFKLKFNNSVVYKFHRSKILYLFRNKVYIESTLAQRNAPD